MHTLSTCPNPRCTARTFLSMFIVTSIVPMWAAAACALHIGAGSTVTLNGTLTVNCIQLDAGGIIYINSGGKLRLTGNGGNTTSTINGTIYLSGSSASLDIVSNNHILTGSGTIWGYYNAAKITIDNGLRLTNQTQIRGALQISSAASATGTAFQNDGLVDAAFASGTENTLNICTDSLLASSGDYSVSASNAILRFSICSTSLTDSFSVSNGALEVLCDLWTSGPLVFTGGSIQVSTGVSFIADQ